MPTETPPDGSLASITEAGAVVSDRFGDASHAFEWCKSRVQADNQVRAPRRAKVQGAFNKNAPKTRAQMQAAGRGNDSNLNFGRHRGHIMQAHSPFFDMVAEIPVCIDADLDTGDAKQDAALVRGFAEYFHRMQFGWRGWDDNNQLRDLQMLLHGPGIVAWEDAWDWRPKAILAGNLYVDEDASCSLDNCEAVLITTTTKSGQLWRKIENKERADAMGWNVEAVREALMESSRGTNDTVNWQWADWERAFKNGDQHVSQKLTKPIRLYSLFVEEMDGTISQRILPIATTKAGKELKYLFKSRQNRASWDEVLCVFPYDIGADGSFYSIKGQGTDIYPFCELLNKIDNNLADTVPLIKPMWQPASAGDLKKFQMVQISGGNMVPHGMNPLNLNMSSGIQPGIEVSREFSSTLAQTISGHSPQDLAAPTVEETAKSAMIRAAERAKSSKGIASRFMRSVDRQYSESFRRAINPKLRDHHPGGKEALKFQAKCKKLCRKLGVEWERRLSAEDSPTGKEGKFTILELVENVRANRSLGLGSAAMRIEIVNQLMANYDRYDEIGQNEILRMFTAVMTSFHEVDALVPSLDGRDPTNDEAVAMQENNAFNILGTSAESAVVPGQNHALHLGVHVSSMEADQAACEAGGDPRECAARLDAKGTHSHQHLAKLQNNPSRKRELAEFGERLRVLASYSDHLAQIIAEQDAANPQEDPASPSPDMVKVQGGLALKAKKQQGDHELKVAKTQADLTLKTEAQRAEEARKNATTAASIQRDTIATAADIAHQRAKASIANTAE